ncbi:hypothetical protein LTR16_008565, partial [Cryomyces antarcticus]
PQQPSALLSNLSRDLRYPNDISILQETPPNIAMCLVKIKEDEDIVVPSRPRRRRSPERHSRRVSRVIVEERAPSRSYIVPAPAPPLAIPAPQPIPIFVQPPPTPIPVPVPVPPPAPSVHSHAPSHHAAHYVEVAPLSRSSSSSSSSSGRTRRSEYHVREREVRRERIRDRSQERSPQYSTFRYIEPPRESYEFSRRERERSKDRSRRGSVYEDPRASRQ